MMVEIFTQQIVFQLIVSDSQLQQWFLHSCFSFVCIDKTITKIIYFMKFKIITFNYYGKLIFNTHEKGIFGLRL